MGPILSQTFWRTQNSVKELKKKLELSQEAIHQGLQKSAKLEKSQMSKISPRIRKFFKVGSDSGSETEAEGERAAPGCGGVSDVSSKARGHVSVVTGGKTRGSLGDGDKDLHNSKNHDL